MLSEQSFHEVTGLSVAGGLPGAAMPQDAEPRAVCVPATWRGRGILFCGSPAGRWAFRWQWAAGVLRLDAVRADSASGVAEPAKTDPTTNIPAEVGGFLRSLPGQLRLGDRVGAWTVTGCHAGQLLLVGEGPLLGPGVVDHWQLSLDRNGVPAFIERALGVSEGPAAQARRVILFPEG